MHLLYIFGSGQRSLWTPGSIVTCLHQGETVFYQARKYPRDFPTGSRAYLGYHQMLEKTIAVGLCMQQNAAHRRPLNHRVMHRNRVSMNITIDLGLRTSGNVSRICGSCWKSYIIVLLLMEVNLVNVCSLAEYILVWLSWFGCCVWAEGWEALLPKENGLHLDVHLTAVVMCSLCTVHMKMASDDPSC